MIESKELKKEIRQLRKLKLQCRAGSNERLELEHKIKALKKQLKDLIIIEPNKEKLIKEILELEKDFPKDLIDLNKYTEEQLQKHIEYIKRKRTIK